MCVCALPCCIAVLPLPVCVCPYLLPQYYSGRLSTTQQFKNLVDRRKLRQDYAISACWGMRLSNSEW